MYRIIQTTVFFLVSVFVGGAAQAYILPAEQLLAFMIERVGPSQTFVVDQKTIVYDPRIEEGMRELTETLYFSPPDSYRSELVGPEVEKVTVVSSEGALAVVDGRIVREEQDPFDHFKDLMLFSDLDRLVEGLLKAGVDVDQVSLGRFDNRVVYVIGAQYPDESVPQVWVDKTHFRPVRFIVQTGRLGQTKEIRYAEYIDAGKAGHYPGRTFFYDSGELVRMNVVETVETRSQVSAEYFDLGHIRDTYPPAEVDTDPPAASESELDEVKRSLEEFRRIFE